MYIHTYIHTYTYEYAHTCTCIKFKGLHADVGWDSVVDILTRYGLDGSGSNLGGRGIITTVQAGPAAHPAFGTMSTVSLSRGKVVGMWCWPPTPSCAVVKERVELYLYYPPGPSWSVLWWTLGLRTYKYTCCYTRINTYTHIRIYIRTYWYGIYMHTCLTAFRPVQHA
jgi:hypothetical protein